MGMKFLRALALASMSMFTATALVAPVPAFAADKSQKDTPKISKAFSKPLSEANKALQAKDWAGALVSLKAAEALPDPTDYETWVTHYYLTLAYYNTGDKKSAAEAVVKAVQAKDIPAQNHEEALTLALSIISEAQEPAKVIEFAKANLAPDAKLSEGVAHNIAYAYYQMKDFASTRDYELKAIAAAKAAGKTPNRMEYKLLEIAQSQLKNTPAVTELAELLASQYGTDEDWGQFIDFQTGTLSSKGGKANKNLTVAALYLYKLRIVTKAESKSEDYLYAAELADSLNVPNDGLTALNAGFAANVLSTPKDKALLAKLKSSVSKDLPTLPIADKTAAKSPKADSDIAVAQGYLSYNKFDDAERVVNRAISKGGPRMNEANLLLGVAQALQGKPEAPATLAKVKGDAVLETAAHTWSVYATRKQAAPAAAPAAN